MASYYLIFDTDYECSTETAKLVAEHPPIERDTMGASIAGLPARYCDHETEDRLYVIFEVDEDADTVTWVPDIGPNPVWTGVWSAHRDDTIAMLRVWDAWALENY